MTHGTHDALDDPRNEDVLIYLNGELVPRAEARVSVFDSGFMMGDGVWEGIRLHNGHFAFLHEHLDRLLEGARAIDLDLGMDRSELTAALHRTVEANGMSSDVHVRLMVTRGPKKTPFQDPRLSLWGPTVVIVPEYKVSNPEAFERGIRLFTAHVRRGPPDVQDPKLNSHSKLNCILAMIQAIKAGCDEALMLDPRGFVATCNSTNFFIVRKGEVWTSSGGWCLNGITRAKVIALCRTHDIPVEECDFSLTEVYGADEAFATGTFAGLIPVIEVDGRTIGEGRPGPETRSLRQLYQQLLESECPGPIEV